MNAAAKLETLHRLVLVVQQNGGADLPAQPRQALAAIGTLLAELRADRLIDAAPELYEALRFALAWFENVKGCGQDARSLLVDTVPDGGGLDKLRAALAKAEGRDT
jgi:hypothetical protein